MKKILLGGGCFWCLEAIFQQVSGVKKVTSGYAGGTAKNPDYKAVCTGTTGYAEVLEIEYNEEEISVKNLFQVFFNVHDPTTLNRQGNDIGTQYRSVIFCTEKTQKIVAEETVRKLTEERVFSKPIVTKILSEAKFYPAEEYHQSYFQNNPNQPYCQAVVLPKLEKFLKK